MSHQRLRKKISLQILQLPKLRHKSTHHETVVKSKTFHCHSTLSRKTISYHIQQPKHKKTLSRVEQSLNKYRSQFKQLTNMSNSLLNQTFFKLNNNKMQLQKKLKLQKRKIYNMEKQDYRSPTQKNNHNSQDFNLVNLEEQIYTGPVIVLDYKIQMFLLNHTCYDGEFSLNRTGATLSFYQNQIYLFGGCPDTVQNNLAFHRFKFQSNEWNHIKTLGQKPTLSFIYHSCNSYKDYMIISGGISIQKIQIKKYNNPHINIFNHITSAWSQYNWGYYLKHHSSCMINNVLIIHGGINQRERTQNNFHFMQLNFSYPQFTKVTTFTSSENLSHHKMITTINEDSRLRGKFKLDGILMFGGKKNQKLSNQLYFMETASFKLTDQDTSIIKRWRIAEIKGERPQARMCHSFDLLVNKGLCVLIGGINQKNEYLNDMWIFDLFGLSWTKVQDVPLLSLTGGIAYHSTVVNQSEIYIYGGITKNQTNKQFYLIQTQKFKRNYSKQQLRKRVDASSNMISFKAFQ